MPRIPIAARNMLALDRHFGPVRPIRGLPSRLAARTHRPRAVWFGTRLPWRLIQAMLPNHLRRLVPYVEPDWLYRQGFEFVRAGSVRGGRPLRTASGPTGGIADGTSNTLVVSETPRAGRGGTGIADGTSNTVVISETPGPGRGDILTGEVPSQGLPGEQIADGTSNTLLVEESVSDGGTGQGSRAGAAAGASRGGLHERPGAGGPPSDASRGAGATPRPRA